MKLRFKLFGHTLFIPIIGILTLFMPYALITGSTLNLTDKLTWSIYFGALAIFTIYFIWNKIFTQLISVNYNEGTFQCLNVVTRKRWNFDISAVKGYEDEYSDEQIIIIIGTNNQPLLILRKHYYSNFEEFGRHLKLEHLERRPSKFRRFWNGLSKKSS